jgi:peptide/nickel transport system permease protein
MREPVMSALLRRLALVLPTLFGVATLVFLFIHLVPGDPVDVMLGERAATADRARMRSALGLDRPLWRQYTSFLTGVARGDLGRSLQDGTPVTRLVLARLPATLVLAVTAAALALLLAIPLGTLSARYHGRWLDMAASGFALLGASMPNIFLGPLLVLFFALRLGWLPVSGADSPQSVILPAVTLGLGMSAILTRLTRAAVLDALGGDFIRTARAKGLSENAIFFRHALRSALLSVTTVFGLQLGGLLGGAIITETIFAWPGLGRLTLQAIDSRDYPLVQGCVLVVACGYVAANLLADLACQRLDPRVRFGAREAR